MPSSEWECVGCWCCCCWFISLQLEFQLFSTIKVSVVCLFFIVVKLIDVSQLLQANNVSHQCLTDINQDFQISMPLGFVLLWWPKVLKIRQQRFVHLKLTLALGQAMPFLGWYLLEKSNAQRPFKSWRKLWQVHSEVFSRKKTVFALNFSSTAIYFVCAIIIRECFVAHRVKDAIPFSNILRGNTHTFFF